MGRIIITYVKNVQETGNYLKRYPIGKKYSSILGLVFIVIMIKHRYITFWSNPAMHGTVPNWVINSYKLCKPQANIVRT